MIRRLVPPPRPPRGGGGAGPTRRALLCGAALTVLAWGLPAPLAASAPASPPLFEPEDGQKLSYAIVRLGSRIGLHHFTFQRRDGRLVVESDLTISVSILSIQVYALNHKSREVWEDGRLVWFSGATNDDGTIHRAQSELRGDRLHVVTDGEVKDSPPLFVASLWRALPTDTRVAIDPIDGDPTSFSVAAGPDETVKVRGEPRRAQRWTWRGGINRDLWYDPSGLLVRVLIKGDDGSDVFYILQ